MRSLDEVRTDILTYYHEADLSIADAIGKAASSHDSFLAWRGRSGPGEARRGSAVWAWVWQGWARQGSFGRVTVRQSRLGMARSGRAWHGEASHVAGKENKPRSPHQRGPRSITYEGA